MKNKPLPNPSPIWGGVGEGSNHRSNYRERLMEKSTGLVAVIFLAALALGCNLSAASAPSAQAPSISPTIENTNQPQDTPRPSSTPTSTATGMRGSTPGPTPTQVAKTDCPPYAFDSIAADFSSTTDPLRFIGKHYNPDDYNGVFGGESGEMLDDVHALKQFSKETLSVDFLERLVCRNSGGKAFFEVKDAVILLPAEDQSIARICWGGEQPIQPVLALGHVDVQQPEQTFQDTTGWRYDRVDFVYRIDLERETFTQIPPEGVVCFEVFEGGD
jgi:hypothetical protein